MKLNKKILMVGALLIAFTACNSDKKDDTKINDKANTEVTESTKNAKNTKDNEGMIVNPPIENLEITYSSDEGVEKSENIEDEDSESEVDENNDN